MQRIVLLVGFLILSGTAWCSQMPTPVKGMSTRDQQQSAAEQNRETKTDQRGTNEYPLVIKLTNTGKTDAETQQERNDIKDNATVNGIVAISTLILAAFTIVLAITGICQARISSNTTKQELRAYLSADENPDRDNRDYSINTNTHRASALLCITNYGKTPAYEVCMKGRIEYMPFSREEAFKFPEFEYGQRVIDPGQQHFLRVKSDSLYADLYRTKPKFRKDITEIKNDEKCWHVFGFVTYRDTFGGRHYIKFCYLLSWDKGPDNSPGWYTHHYETDDKFS
ncbi:MAG TPA: hypothetical protein VGO35_06045 [Gammaproteobacteria bacterium]|jgi:hypothetical protein|nr:hypothetical protein [Gammaproteobacteria bacterium]